jgi:hypothetical protein
MENANERRLFVITEMERGNLEVAATVNRESKWLQVRNDSKKELLTAPIQCG